MKNETAFFKQLDQFAVILQRLPHVAHGVSLVVGQQRVEGQLEEGVQRLAAGVDGRYARRCQYHVALLRVLGDISEECRLSRARLSGEEERAPGVLYDLEGLLPLLIVQVEGV